MTSNPCPSWRPSANYVGNWAKMPSTCIWPTFLIWRLQKSWRPSRPKHRSSNCRVWVYNRIFWYFVRNMNWMRTSGRKWLISVMWTKKPSFKAWTCRPSTKYLWACKPRSSMPLFYARWICRWVKRPNSVHGAPSSTVATKLRKSSTLPWLANMICKTHIRVF